MILFWIGFIVLIVALLALDLGVFNRKAHVIETREAVLWTLGWIFCAALFGVLVYFAYAQHWLGIGIEHGTRISGTEAALQYLTGYLIEEMLSLDNIFVMALVFAYFGVPAQYQHRALFWGIFGALVMRGIMIAAGVALIQRFEWIIFVFGGFLILTALKLLVSGQKENVHPEKIMLVRFAKKLFPVTRDFAGTKFFVRQDGTLSITPLFLVLLTIESLDVMFAVDSIPAIFGVTKDPFIVFSSNVFAILGLRSIYFALAAVMRKFRYLKLSLVFVLGFVGAKMLASEIFPISIHVSLGVIAVILGIGIAASLMKKNDGQSESGKDGEPGES